MNTGICPGSGFVSLHTDPVPDPIFIIQNQIHITGNNMVFRIMSNLFY